VSDLDHRPRRPVGPVVMSADKLGRGTAVQDVSLELRAGEIFGIAGLVGSGRTELVRLLFGADRADRGSVTLHPDFEQKQAPALDEQAQSAIQNIAKTPAITAPRTWHRGFASPLQAIASGVGLVTEDRKSQGLLLSQPIRINATLSDLSAVSRGGWLQRGLESRLVQGFIRTLRVRCHGPEQPVGQLSGGNQQKVVFPAGCTARCACCSWTNPRAAWTWARAPSCMASWTAWPWKAARCSWCRPTCANSWPWPTASA